ncbi:uncharacterized protein [Nyctibius grandis]|uniref:uncharacterized protein n=1 Tax=Nyctibius grandis TaxID=48427 RepID=UPI0035BBFDBA
MIKQGVVFSVLSLLWILDLTKGHQPIVLPPTPWKGSHNVWVTLMRSLNQTQFCASLAQPEQPFHTFLVGVPLNRSESKEIVAGLNVLKQSLCENAMKCGEHWDLWDDSLPVNPLEPQELDILGTLEAESCVFFNYTEGSNIYQNDIKRLQNVTPSNPLWQNESIWCANVGRSRTEPAPDLAMPRKLPEGLFLICGDRAWPGLPSKKLGGPCTIGKLSLLMPTRKVILNHTNLHKIKRSVTTLGKECKDEVELWSRTKVVLSSIFAPGVAAAQGLTQLRNLACWVAKRADQTSRILGTLANDVDSIRHATLQNRAAIDFLLLVHGHGCQEFDGMCCMDLNDHSRSIHKQIKELMDATQKIREQHGFLDDWLGNLGIGGWLVGLIKMLLMGLFVICIIILVLPCLFSCLQRALQRTINTAFLAQEKKGGIVEGFLEQNGHVMSQKYESME